MEVSVIIPTYSREECLKECLNAFLKQDFDKEYEVIVVDDGSTSKYDLSDQIMHNEKIVYVKKEHAGPAIARNYGIKITKGKYVIFVGDDIICASGFIKNHYDFLLCNKDTISAGATVWHPSTPNTDLFSLLQYIGLGNFTTENSDDCGFYSFTTSNIAIPKLYLNMEQFDETFPFPALEDNELGFRLYKHGLKIKYNSKATAYHKHTYTLEHLKRRQWELGYSIGYLIRKYPELRNFYVRPTFYTLLSAILRLKIFSFLKFYNQLAICVYEKYKGLRDFQKKCQNL